MGVAERLNLPPELPTIRAALPPAPDQVGNVRGQYPGGWPPLQPSGAGRRVSPEVGIHGWAADIQLPGHSGDGSPMRPECTYGLIDGDPAGVPRRPCGILPQLHRLGAPAPAPAPVQGCDRDRARRRHERHCRTYRGRLKRRPAVQQEGFQRLAEVLDEVEAIDHLHRLGCPPANPVGVEVAVIATDDGDRGMLGQPGCHSRSRAVRQ
jgi:hypothetical protein